MLNRHVRRKIRNWFAGLCGPPLVHVWIRTLRFRWHGDLFRAGRLAAARTNGIFVFWHQRLLTLGGYFRNSRFYVMISQHSDGELIARIIEGLGMKAVRGSSTRGGARVVRELMKEDNPHLNLAVTPDGPKGPKHCFHPGAVYLSSRTGLPVYPVAISLKRFWSLPTWDGFQLPRPFSRALIRLGEPVHVPPDLDKEHIEEYRQLLEGRLRQITDETDRDFDALYAEAKRLKEYPLKTD